MSLTVCVCNRDGHLETCLERIGHIKVTAVLGNMVHQAFETVTVITFAAA